MNKYLKIEPLLAHRSPWVSLLALIMLILVSTLITFFVGLLLVVPVYGSDVLEMLVNAGQSFRQENIALLKYFQIVNQIGVFFIPVFLFSFLKTGSPGGYLQMNRFPTVFSLFAVIFLTFSILPVIHWLSGINEGMRLPGFLRGVEEWMQQAEEKNQRLTEAFLSTTTIGGLLLNILMIGVLAAIGEELLFRSVLIRLFRNWFGNVHFAVIISSVIFSAFHLQFYGFLPRLVLGLMFGYMFVWSGSVWLPVAAHFLNNTSAVVVYYLVNTGYIETPADDFGATDSNMLIFMSFSLSAAMLILVYLAEKKKQQNWNIN